MSLLPDNPVAAQRYIHALRERCEFYMASPLLGQAEPDIAVRLSLAPDQVRSFLYRNHRCYYVVTDEEMRVFGFIDTRRDRQAALDERLPS